MLMQQCSDVSNFLRIISSKDDVVNIHKKGSYMSVLRFYK